MTKLNVCIHCQNNLEHSSDPMNNVCEDCLSKPEYKPKQYVLVGSDAAKAKFWELCGQKDDASKKNISND